MLRADWVSAQGFLCVLHGVFPLPGKWGRVGSLLLRHLHRLWSLK